MTKNLDDIIEVEWLDAADHTDEQYADVTKYSVLKYLVRRRSYGVVIKKDTYGILLLTDIDEDGKCEFTTIPKGMIVKPKYDKIKEVKNYNPEVKK